MAGLGEIGNFGESIINIGQGLFGTDVNTTGKTTGTKSQNVIANRSGETRTGLEISQEAVTRIIEDVLGSADGLAAAFQGEQNSGIFNSSVAKQAAGNLTAKLVGEIAKLQAQEVTTIDQTDTKETEEEFETKNKTETENEGLLEGLF